MLCKMVESLRMLCRVLWPSGKVCLTARSWSRCSAFACRMLRTRSRPRNARQIEAGRLAIPHLRALLEETAAARAAGSDPNVAALAARYGVDEAAAALGAAP